MGHAEVIEEVGAARRYRYGFHQMPDGFRVSPFLVFKDPEKVKSVGISRLARQDEPIGRLGLIQAAGTVIGRCCLKDRAGIRSRLEIHAGLILKRALSD
jgi:hypothetical protein